jgi:putative ABC transport system permease protein
MIKFMLKGILRDRSRSLLPLLVVGLGAAVTVLGQSWLEGVMGEALVMSARFDTGHLKVVTRPCAEALEQMPLDLALTGSAGLKASLQSEFPDVDWVERIRFGGLADFPDSSGETLAQGPVAGWAIDLFGPSSREGERFGLEGGVETGRSPREPGEALITGDLAERFGVGPGDRFTFFGSTASGALAFQNFTVSGTVRFGSPALDRGAIIIDLADAQRILGLEDGAGEILGFFPRDRFDRNRSDQIAVRFNRSQAGSDDPYAPVMLRMSDQGGMSAYMDFSDRVAGLMITAFVLAMSVVLWNTGLLGGLRRYNEFGLRLALGEDKHHLYRSLICEAFLIGAIGSAAGTALGLGVSYLVQLYGFNVGDLMKNSTLMFPSVVRTRITPASFCLGFIPGLLSMTAGSALAGLGIYRRSTAQLFKELEA